MKFRALIFDVDGTLAETEEAHREAFNRTFAEWGLDWSWSREAYRELLKTTGGKERILRYQSELPIGSRRLKGDEIAILYKEKTDRYMQILQRGGLELRPGVREMIANAKQHAVRVAVATTTNLPNVEALCQSCWGMPAGEVFDQIAAGDMVPSKKPAPGVYQLALRQLNLNADECIAFEDSRNGVLSARAAGLRVLVTPSAYTDEDDFSGADWVVPSLEAENLPQELQLN